MTYVGCRSAVVLACVVTLAAPIARADDATARARSHYEMGLKLFDSREHEQALIEFSRANEIKPRPAALFMMAQCEYLLGRLKDARAHYQGYITEVPNGEFVDLARDRIESIDKRLSTFAINTVPDEATVLISPEGQTGKVIASGQAPNNFSVPRGRYRVDVTKPNYQGETRIVEIDIAETKPLFFKLDPIPARLEIETTPPGATLYVQGNRARNPYRQDVPPGAIEIFAEAPNYESKTTEIVLAPGERKLLIGPSRLQLSYKQRSGRPELLFASGLIGALVGAGAVAAGIGGEIENANVASVLLIGGGGVAGAVAGSVVATPLVPKYLPDNRALFILGGMWMGAAEGAGVGMLWRQVRTHDDEDIVPCAPTLQEPCRAGLGDQLRAAFIGSLPGLAVGLAGGSLLAHKAPSYGRVTLIQSAALGGLFAGALGQVTLQWKPYGEGWEYSVRVATESDFMRGIATEKAVTCVEGALCAFHEYSLLDLVPGGLIGFNVGLAAGLAAAYLPNQARPGPSWRRVLLIDLAAGAGALAAGVGTCVALVNDCLLDPQPGDDARAIAAGMALVGGGLGLLGGVLLTRGIDDDNPENNSPTSISMATFAPMRDASGRMAPAFAAMGSF